jgi:hypothetical protein
MEDKYRIQLVKIDKWSISMFISMFIFLCAMGLSNSLHDTLGENHHRVPSVKTGEIYRFAATREDVYITKTEQLMVNSIDSIKWGGLIVGLLLCLKVVKLPKS